MKTFDELTDEELATAREALEKRLPRKTIAGILNISRDTVHRIIHERFPEFRKEARVDRARKDVARMVTAGMTCVEIAKVLHYSLYHVRRIKQRTKTEKEATL